MLWILLCRRSRLPPLSSPLSWSEVPWPSVPPTTGPHGWQFSPSYLWESRGARESRWASPRNLPLRLLPPVISSCTIMECFARRRHGTESRLLPLSLEGEGQYCSARILCGGLNKIPPPRRGRVRVGVHAGAASILTASPISPFPPSGGRGTGAGGQSRAETYWGKGGALFNAFQVRLDVATPRARLAGWPGASPSFMATRRA
jgi:hypothetical protein